MTSADVDEQHVRSLEARISELEVQNRRLASSNAAASLDGRVDPGRAGVWRAIVSAVCLVLASVLLPLSIVAAWVRVEMVEEDRFVATLSPLADDRAVQSMIIDEVTAAVNERVDVSTITSDIFDGLATLDLPPRAATALGLLEAPLTDGLQGLIDQAITRVVTSEAFADVWSRVLRAGHRALVAAGTGGSSGGAIEISDSGEVGIQLQPIVAEVKQRLVDRGIGIASAIPDVNRTVVVAQSDALVSIRAVYSLAVTLGWLLPILTLVLFIAGVLFARRRSTALLGAGAGVAVSSAILLIGMGVGEVVLSLQGADAGVPASALGAIYDQVTAQIRQTAIVALVLGVLIAGFAWLQGRWRGAVAARRVFGNVNASVRERSTAYGVKLGGFGIFMDRQRVLVRVLIGVLWFVWLWLLRPLTVGEVLGVTLVALLVWWLCELLRRPTSAPEPASPSTVLRDEPLPEEAA